MRTEDVREPFPDVSRWERWRIYSSIALLKWRREMVATPILLLFTFGLMGWLGFCAPADVASTVDDAESRIFSFRRCGGPGCPYAASWLANVNFYRTIPWWLSSTKMEAATFNIFGRAKLKFQLADHDAFYVHHMSSYEHQVHKKYGFEETKNKTTILSRSAYDGECGQLQIAKTKEHIALIPFYGGRPPGVTKDLAVKSIGEGNSLVDGYTKGLQTMAVVCSCLKYFGRVVIGVARDEDRILINDLLQQKQTAEARHHINVVQFEMARPSHLPFHLLAWGQQYIRVHNCYPFLPKTAAVGGVAMANISQGALIRGGVSADRLALFSPLTQINISTDSLPNNDAFEICRPDAVARSHQGPLKPVYLKKFDIGRHRHVYSTAAAAKSSSQNTVVDPPSATKSTGHAIRYVYFTEADQIVRFDSLTTVRAVSAAANDSTLFVGRRKEKDGESDPTDYLGGLGRWKDCGTPGYSMNWPTESTIRLDRLRLEALLTAFQSGRTSA